MWFGCNGPAGLRSPYSFPCYSGAFDGPQDCLAESLLRSPHGPVAVYAGSRVTMPYAMAVMGHELMHEYFLSQSATLGEAILQAKRRMAESRSLDATETRDARCWLDAVASTLHAGPELLHEERLEHILLFNLLGDPLLKLRVPKSCGWKRPRPSLPASGSRCREKRPCPAT